MGVLGSPPHVLSTTGHHRGLALHTVVLHLGKAISNHGGGGRGEARTVYI